MTHPTSLRDKARALRVEKHLTLDELAERLALPRTTIFSWVRDLPIPARKQTVPQGLGTRAMEISYRQRRDQAYAEGAIVVHPPLRAVYFQRFRRALCRGGLQA